VPAIPRTMTGKKLELPVKRIMLGDSAEKVASRDALADPAAIDAFVSYAGSRASNSNAVTTGRDSGAG
jgi:acetoacetyl-CoA synthetase